MRAVRLLGQNVLELVEVPVPQPGPGEVRIAMRAAGICGTDLAPYRATGGDRPWPVTPGHEACGDVDMLGAGVTGWAEGDRVVVHPSYGCWQCEQCRLGNNPACRNRRRLGASVDGSDADFMTAPERNLLRLPDDLSYLHGMLLACNFGTAYQAVRRAETGSADTVVVFGAGGVGRAAALTAAAGGAQVVIVDPNRARLDGALGLGIGHGALDRHQLDAVLAELTGGIGASVAIDCSGSPGAQLAALEVCRYQGRVVYVGFNRGELTVRPFQHIVERQLTVIGSTAWPISTWSQMTGFVRHHQIPLDALVGQTLPFGEAAAGFESAARGDAGKVTFAWEPDATAPAADNGAR